METLCTIFARYQNDGDVHGLTFEGNIFSLKKFSPLGKHLLDAKVSKLDAQAVGFGERELGFTYQEVLMELLTAVNYLKLKEYPEELAQEGQPWPSSNSTGCVVWKANPTWGGGATCLHQGIHVGTRVHTADLTTLASDLLFFASNEYLPKGMNRLVFPSQFRPCCPPAFW